LTQPLLACDHSLTKDHFLMISGRNTMPPTLTKPLYLTAGWACFGLGFVGIFLPLLPTTIFWILAAGCWSKSNPELAQRIFSHPRFGKPIQIFLEHRQISRKSKRFASAGMTLGFLTFVLVAKPSWVVAGIVGFVLACVIGWIVSLALPTDETDSATSA